MEKDLEFLFAQYPNEKGFWMTSDGQFFTENNKQDAVNHGNTLEDKKIKLCAREEKGKGKKVTEKPAEEADNATDAAV
jgi:hypothetical protein